MISMMLVDDKRDVVEGIESMHDWEADSIEIVSKAYDGRTAFEDFKKYRPDIIISDIRMPHMNGLELVRSVKEIDENVKVILLSGYDDFEYAQKALEYGAEEYLLKPADVKAISESVGRAKNKIMFEDNQKKAQVQTQQKLIQSLPLLRDQYIQYLVRSSNQEPLDIIRDKFEFLDISLRLEELIVIVFEIDNYRELSKHNSQLTMELFRFSIMNIVNDTVDQKNGCEMFRFNNDRLILVYNANTRLNQLENLNVACSLSDQVRHYVEKFLGITVTIVIGDYCKSIRGFNAVCDRAFESLGHKLRFGDNSVITVSDVIRKEVDSAEYSKKAEEELLAAIRIGNSDEVDMLLKRYMSSLYKSFGDNPDAFKKYVFELAVAVFRLNTEVENQLFDLKHELDYVYNLKKLKTYGEIERWISECIFAITDQMSSERMSQIEKDIEKAKQYIRIHLEENVSLKKVSEHIALSQNYFSAMFKEIVGRSFIDYLIDCRIEKAKALLDKGNMKVYEIANSVGYNDRRYFSEVFKKHVGMTPAEYLARGK